ncbi:NDP-hexose 2,3-dehydratase [Streptomyces tubercidicus]|uniref:NDP-hexose 2,3-dehydratase n=2 Tax=Streptomyces tubercidicus TaxID=47759 RepID=A0A640V2G6_9ACTN|nr:NDP-hexose 2,3-dehydratase family protein [Streptomyces tubercidicus]GFE41877.1 NDP-hexose 2,3-dehydratase [Streptomyces tubercidicus]
MQMDSTVEPLYSSGSTVSSRRGRALPARLAASALATEGGVMSNEAFHAWFEERQRTHALQVSRIPLGDLRGWNFAPGTGNLRHDSGRFFSVEGLRVRSDYGPVREWCQPIIHQPEIGVLGIAVREIDGVLHCLMQAKPEPGNLNGVQLSPTVQATKSNYTRVHGGSAVPYMDCFIDPDPSRVLADVLQSEQGSWFFRKRNRNMVVEVGPEVEAGEDFCWVTLGQLGGLLRHPDLVNMDARTVLSCIPDWRAGSSTRNAGLHSDTEIRSWITTRRARHEITAEPWPLREAAGWHRSDEAISHESGLFFSIVAVDVSSHRREVPAWSQPLLEPHGLGIAALLVKRIGGVSHALLSARVEPGFLDVVELGPTVQCTPESYDHLPSGQRPRYLDVVLDRRPERTLFDAVLSEEGGRFQHARSRYLIIEVDEDFPTEAPEDFRWVTLPQVNELLKYSHHLNVQARTLVAGMRALP